MAHQAAVSEFPTPYGDYSLSDEDKMKHIILSNACFRPLTGITASLTRMLRR